MSGYPGYVVSPRTPYSDYGTKWSPYSTFAYPPKTVSYNTTSVVQEETCRKKSPISGTMCCLLAGLGLLALGLFIAACVLGMMVAQSGDFICPDGYELDTSGTTCNVLTTAAADATDATAAGNDVTTIAGETNPAATDEAATDAAATTAATIPTGAIPAPAGTFVSANSALTGPTYLPKGWAAYPGSSIAGGDLQDSATTGNLCLEACIAEETCKSFDFNTAYAQCYFHYLATTCDVPTSDASVYHMSLLPECGAPFPDATETNP
ncbi:hypothetical protein CAPTEDRAFT_221864 [Capitella teleta]|uniref:Apple domain-containing protein n=1 Tax=Capitella teleta TaxID=283909 RepID=R7TTF7_CAPTE|nr:hypothetical protein CAPTEDRAFT_221864 [Capitella teleta]|eukprot:ELT96949.1 hypothetical protein CAPTEDRAFT_221864 [Capitella teleta]